MRPHQTQLPQSNRNDLKTIKNLVPYLWTYRGRVILALIALILAKVAMVGAPVILKEIIDALDASKHTGRASIVLPVLLLLAYGALRVGNTVFNEIRDSVFSRVRHGAMHQMSSKVVGHMHNLSLRFHLDRKTGAITRDLERGTRSVSSLLNYMVFSILPILVEVSLIAFYLLSQYSAWYAVVTFTTVIIYILVTMLITEWRMKYRITMNQMDSKANSQAVDSLLNYETVKYFTNEKREIDNYDKTLSAWEDAAVKSQTSLSALNVGQGTIIAIGVTTIMMMAANGVVNKTMTLGDLVLVNAFMIQMFIPLNFLGVVYSQFKHALSDMERMFNLLDEPQEIKDAPNASELTVTRGEIVFDHVYFRYTPDRPILNDISFSVSAGEKIAIVGESGSGKSTLSRLLVRFYDVESGRILIDGQSISQVTQISLRQHIGVVPQDTVLFNDTLHYNIAYAKPEASEEEIIDAAKMANIHDFIMALPDGYQSRVGERGLKLSGGEKQRVAIARTILKNPRILIFDEATSSLDSKSEKQILDAIARISSNHTALVIAHRLSTIIDADRILVMDQGEIKEQGTHAQLIAQNGRYAALWKLQQEEQKKMDELNLIVSEGHRNPS